jgi:hypothetical protein
VQWFYWIEDNNMILLQKESIEKDSTDISFAIFGSVDQKISIFEV